LTDVSIVAELGGGDDGVSKLVDDLN